MDGAHKHNVEGKKPDRKYAIWLHLYIVQKLVCGNKGQEGGYLWEQQSGGVQRVVGC